MTADAEDDNYLDDEDADWKTTAQGQKAPGTPVLRWRGSRESPGRKN